MSQAGQGEGVRLAKRVAALQGCSRSQAEGLIATGTVQVDGQVVTDPAHRVADDTVVQIGEVAAVGAITVLLYKPAGMASAQALRQSWPALALGPLPPVGLKELLPLPQQAAGLSVWSQERPVMRRLQDRERPIEMEWLLTMPMAAADVVIAPLQAGGCAPVWATSARAWASGASSTKLTGARRWRIFWSDVVWAGPGRCVASA